MLNSFAFTFSSIRFLINHTNRYYYYFFSSHFAFCDNLILPGTKIIILFFIHLVLFYDNLILPGTKIIYLVFFTLNKFYDNLILPGTKISHNVPLTHTLFYDNLILSGTKISNLYTSIFSYHNIPSKVLVSMILFNAYEVKFNTIPTILCIRIYIQCPINHF